MENRGLVFISGPYTKPDPIENTHKIIRVADKLVDLGFVPFIPHLSLLWHIVSPHPIDFWYAYDNEILKRCDAMLRIDGESPGADNEETLARDIGIPIYFSIEELDVATSRLSREQGD